MNALNIYIIAGIISAFVIVLATIVIMIFAPNQLNRDCALRHNHYRHFHRSPFLSVSNELVKYAEKRAEKLRDTNLFAHSRDNPFGENLYKIRPVESESLKSFECEAATKPWYDEIDNYDFKTGKPIKHAMIGHFTQMVWTDTTDIGCATSYSDKTKTLYLVCNYDPPGNVVGLFHEKVPLLH